jgi:hypothetical protein
LKTLTTSGEAVPIAERVQQSFSPTTVGMFSVSGTEMLVYATGVGDSDSGLQLTWFDRTGKTLGTVGEPLYFSDIELSPDGKNLVVSVFHARGEDLWTYDLSKGLPMRFTFDPARADFPLWSPDGRGIAFNSVRKGHWDLYRKSADGSGVEELMYADDRDKYPNSWAPDGKSLVFVTLDGSGSNGNWTLPLAAERTMGIACDWKCPEKEITGPRHASNLIRYWVFDFGPELGYNHPRSGGLLDEDI